MKKVLLVGIMFMAFMGVVSASSINGDYKGNPVVKLLNNGVEVVADDTPAIIYDNRTMVPIYLLKKMGANITWDLDKYSVDVELPQTTPLSNNTVSDKNPDLIKYAKLANMYKLTQDEANKLVGLSNFLSLYFTGHNNNDPNAYTDQHISDMLTQAIDNYNLLSNKFNSVVKELVGLDTSDLSNAIKSEYDAIDKYKSATVEVIEWRMYKDSQDYTDDQTSFNNYLGDSNAGFTLSNQVFKQCSNGYDAYILKVIS